MLKRQLVSWILNDIDVFRFNDIMPEPLLYAKSFMIIAVGLIAFQ